MYDSRSSHFRRPQSAATLGAYFVTLDQERDDLYTRRGRLKGRDEALTAREAIAEGLVDYAAEKAGDEPLDFHHLPGLREIGRDRAMEAFYVDADRAYREAYGWGTMTRRKPRIAAPLDLEERGYSAGSIPLVGTTAKRRAAKRPFSRLSAPQFDPALVSRTLSPVS